MREALAILPNLNVKKIVNLVLVVLSYYYSRLLKRPVQLGKPFSVSIEPTTSCNLRCPECPSGLRAFSRATGNLQPSKFYSTIEELKDHLLYLTFYFQGEPYLNPDFLPMVRYATNQGIFTATSTNAHYLDSQKARETVESGLKRLIISIDGVDQETYSTYRKGGSLSKVLEGTRNLVHWKKQLGSRYPLILLQFLVMRSNQDQIPAMKRLGKELEADRVVFKTTQIYDFQNGSDLIPSDDKYSRYRKNGDGNYHIKNRLRNQCWKMWHSNVVTWDGKVVPCCFDKDAKYQLGDLEKSSFSSIWRGEEYSKFRERVLTSRKQIDICSNCSEGTNVWL